MKADYYIDQLCLHTGLTREQLLCRNKKNEFAEPRQVLMYAMRTHGKISLNDIASAVERKSHATIMYATKRVAGLIEADKKFKRKYARLFDKLDGRKRVYIAGKITGENYQKCWQKFEIAEKALSQMGHEPVSPLKLVPEGTSWKQAMKTCISTLMHCDAIYLLPDHQDSGGATIEKELGQMVGIEFIQY